MLVMQRISINRPSVDKSVNHRPNILTSLAY